MEERLRTRFGFFGHRCPLPLDPLEVSQLPVGLVHQVGTRQRVSRALARQLAAGDPAQAVVDEGKQLVKRAAVAASRRPRAAR